MRSKGDHHKKHRFDPSKLRTWQRVVLIILALALIVLSLVQVTYGILPGRFGTLSYILAALALALGIYYLSVAVPKAKSSARSAIDSSPILQLLLGNMWLRTLLLAIPSAGVNIVYTVINLIIGIVSRSLWFVELAAYYLVLGYARAKTVRDGARIALETDADAGAREEIKIFRRNSFLFLFLAATLAVMVFLLLFYEGGKTYPGITIYFVGTYTFYKIINSIMKALKNRQVLSPLVRSLNRIGYVDACVSTLILQTALLSAFGEKGDTFEFIMNAITGVAVSVFIAAIGLQGLSAAKKMESGFPPKDA